MDILKNKNYLCDISRVLSKLSLDTFENCGVLVTGGLGLIGSSVVDILLAYHQNYGADLRIYVADINADGFAARYGEYPCVTYVPYDATKPIDFDFNVDFIIHGAGLASPELYVKKPVETMLSNFNGVQNLLEYSRIHGIRRMLYISSSEVYGIKSTEDSFKENLFGTVDINQLRSSYSEAKRASEVLCRSYSAEYDVDTVMVRPGHIYGPAASPRDNRIASEFSYLAAQGKDLEMKSAGLQKRSYCYALDCAAAILVALLKGEKGESYNIGHDEVTSIRRMAEIIASAGGVNLKVNAPTSEDLKQFNPMNNSSLDDRKIKSLGYSDTFHVEEGLTHTVKILKELYFS